MTHTVRQGFVRVLATVAVLALAWPVAAAQRAPSPSSGRQASAGTGQAESAPVRLTDEGTAEQTRDQLDRLFEKYPPAVGRVLKLDPSLIAPKSMLENLANNFDETAARMMPWQRERLGV